MRENNTRSTVAVYRRTGMPGLPWGFNNASIGKKGHKAPFKY